MHVIKRIIGLVLLVLGLALAGLGIWFVSFLGQNGTARFAVTPVGTTPVVMDPAILNRTDLPVTIVVTPKAGSTALVTVATPSDTAAVVGSKAVDLVTRVEVKDKRAIVTRRGEGGGLDLSTVNVWRSRQVASGPTTVVVRQDAAPETVVIAPQGGGALQSVTMSWSRGAWFKQAVEASVAGAGIALVGAVLAFRRTRRDRRRESKPETGGAHAVTEEMRA